MVEREHALAWQLAVCLAALLCLVAEAGCSRLATSKDHTSEQFAKGGPPIPLSPLPECPDPRTRSSVRSVAVSPDGRYVAFDYTTALGEPDHRTEVWATSIGGNSPHPVCNSIPGQTHCDRPAWFPDSLRLVYRSLSKSTGADLVAASVDGTDKRSLTDTPDIAALWPVPDPRGRWIAYFAYISDHTEHLFIVQSSGGEPIHIASVEDSFVHKPTWSADGSELFFLDIGSDEQWSIKVAKLADSNVVAINTLLRRRGLAWCFSISPDGKYLTYGVSGDRGYIGDLFISEMSAVEHSKRLVGPVALPSVHWDSLSSSICFLRLGEGEQASLYKMDINSGEETQLATNVSNLAQDNAWTSEGQIVFVRSADEIWIIRDDGTNERRIFSPQEVQSSLDSKQW